LDSDTLFEFDLLTEFEALTLFDAEVLVLIDGDFEADSDVDADVDALFEVDSDFDRDETDTELLVEPLVDTLLESDTLKENDPAATDHVGLATVLVFVNTSPVLMSTHWQFMEA
jgi:hypothetical protein